MGCRTGGASFTTVCTRSAGSDAPGFSLTASSKSHSTKEESQTSGPITVGLLVVATPELKATHSQKAPYPLVLEAEVSQIVKGSAVESESPDEMV
jgi:hypothetical protein